MWSIPALAGKPPEAGPAAVPTGVYPRARGEAVLPGWPDAPRRGLSPRSRGSLRGPGTGTDSGGSIPALAGKPATDMVSYLLTRVYPRARGEAAQAKELGASTMGLSPRSRGSPSHTIYRLYQRGSIPALAGKPFAGDSEGQCAGVYPRARGEAKTDANRTRCLRGLSPRSRGSRSCRSSWLTTRGSIPALAGKPPKPAMTMRPITVYPRARGEARSKRQRPRPPWGLSPRSRGSQ